MKFDLLAIVGSIMSGCVSVTACCNNIDPSSAIIVGGIGACIYKSTVDLFNRLQIDDPLQVSQIHGFCGLWGLIAVGIFDKDAGLLATGQFRQLGIQLVGALAILAWDFFICFTFFMSLNSMNRFRVGQAFELVGMDTLE